MAYKGPSVYLEQLLFEPDHSLIHQSLSARKSEVTVNADGFGLGWYDERDEPGLYHEILPAWSDCNLKSLAKHIKSPLFFAHVRASTGTSTNRNNCHPFGYENWLFMHNGQVGGYENLRWWLDRQLPEELYPHRRGATDSEALFLMMVANGLAEQPEKAIRATLRSVHNEMQARGIDEPLRFTSVLSDGQRLWAIRYASDHHAPSLYIKTFADYLVVGSEPLELSGEGWDLIEQDTITCIEAMNYQVVPLLLK
jgi:glutamine amidotransferase